jgi:hypothetical protein
LVEAQVPPQVRGPERRALEQAVNEAFVQTFRLVMLVCAGLALAGALCAAVTPGAPRGNALARKALRREAQPSAT